MSLVEIVVVNDAGCVCTVRLRRYDVSLSRKSKYII